MGRLRLFGVMLLAVGAIAVARNEHLSAAALPTRVPAPTYEWRPSDPAPTLPTPMPTAAPDLAERIDARLQSLHQMGWFSGAVLVARDGEVILAKGYGQADDEGTPLTEGTPFRAGQLAEEFTVAALLLLEEEGKLWVHDPVCQYLPDCPEDWQSHTIHELLASPITAELPLVLRQGTFAADQEQLGEALRQAPQSNDEAYVIAVQVIEQVSGMSYGDFVEERLFDPIGMSDSGCGDGPARMAQGYAMPGSPVVEDSEWLPASPAACVYSTVEDLWRWDQALDGGAILGPAARSRMFSLHTSPGSQWATYWGCPYLGYGYGWMVALEKGHHVVEAGGRIPGYLTQHVRYDEDGLTLIILSNQENSLSPRDAIVSLLLRG